MVDVRFSHTFNIGYSEPLGHCGGSGGCHKASAQDLARTDEMNDHLFYVYLLICIVVEKEKGEVIGNRVIYKFLRYFPSCLQKAYHLWAFLKEIPHNHLVFRIRGERYAAPSGLNNSV